MIRQIIFGVCVKVNNKLRANYKSGSLTYWKGRTCVEL
jgi:hypothetical protein